MINVLGDSMNVQEFSVDEDFSRLSKVHKEPFSLYFQNLAWVRILVKKEKDQFFIPNIRLTWRKMGRKTQKFLIFQFDFIDGLPWDLKEWA